MPKCLHLRILKIFLGAMTVDSPVSPNPCPEFENLAAVAAGGRCGHQTIGLRHAFSRKKPIRKQKRIAKLSIEKHVEISIQRTSKPYREVHEWIDELQHKNERNDITHVLEFSRMFEETYDEEAAREYIQHLTDDLNGKFNHLVDVQALVDKTLVYFGAKKQ